VGWKLLSYLCALCVRQSQEDNFVADEILGSGLNDDPISKFRHVRLERGESFAHIAVTRDST
jgi:hypothetical protein